MPENFDQPQPEVTLPDTRTALLPVEYFVNSQANCRDLFDTTARSFSHSFSGTVTHRLLQEIAAGSQTPLLPETVKQLKGQRKPGLILKSAFVMLDANHVAPPDHHALFKGIGAVLDAAPLPVLAASRAAQTLDLLKTYTSDSIIRSFTPDSYDSFTEWYHDTLNEIHRLLDFDQLPSRDFHNLKKIIRHFLNLYQIKSLHQSTVKSPDSQLQSGCETLTSLNKMLGNDHDQMVQDDLHHIQTYSNNCRELAPALHDSITSFFGLSAQPVYS